MKHTLCDMFGYTRGFLGRKVVASKRPAIGERGAHSQRDQRTLPVLQVGGNLQACERASGPSLPSSSFKHVWKPWESLDTVDGNGKRWTSPHFHVQRGES
jgi:hypothetical protein